MFILSYLYFKIKNTIKNTIHKKQINNTSTPVYTGVHVSFDGSLEIKEPIEELNMDLSICGYKNPSAIFEITGTITTPSGVRIYKLLDITSNNTIFVTENTFKKIFCIKDSKIDVKEILKNKGNIIHFEKYKGKS